jgi:predicted AlkP superfamily pyrophosphatase or phosphodiesterase
MSNSSKAKTRHLILISLDDLNSEDYNRIRDYPNFKKLIESGSYAKELISVYPSITYPIHVTMVTGRYPVDHGVVGNELFHPGETVHDWYWYDKYIKTPTIYALAKQAHLKVGAILWPAVAKADIDYNLPEIWPTRGENLLWLILMNGSFWFLARVLFRFRKMISDIQRHDLDDLTTACASYLIESKKPNLLLIHLHELDSKRHDFGVDSGEAIEVLERHDARIGRIMEAVQDAGIGDQTTFLILGDHGSMNVSKTINLNAAFREAGLITTNRDKRIIGWKAILQSCDGSAYVFLKDPADGEARGQVEKILRSAREAREGGIELVFTKEEAVKMGANRDCDYMLEARDGYYFSEALSGGLVEKIDPAQIDYDKKVYAASHGYLPSKHSSKTWFLASGAGIRKGVVMESIRMVDICPTMAALLGLEMPGTDGRILEEILDK